MKPKHLILCFFVAFGMLLSPCRLLSQGTIADTLIGFTTLSIDYLPNSPQGDLRNRFGYTNMLGMELGYKFSNNFYLTGGMRALFGSMVKEPIADNIVDLQYFRKSGYVGSMIGGNGQFSDVRYFQWGYVIPVRAGYILPFGPKPNKNSGIYVESGFQFIQHKVRIEVPLSNIPLLDNDLKPGYDRLTNGLGVVEGIGYRYFSNNRLLNFSLGLEASQNFTKNRRDINVDTGQTDFEQRMDILLGIKVSWIFLIYNSYPEQVYRF